MEPSKYIIAAQHLGFNGYEKSNDEKITMEEQQEALLRIFQLAGYFNLSNLWHDLYCMGNIENLDQVFHDVASIVKHSKADQSDPTLFDVKYMRTNLFNSTSIDLQDVLDYILYIAQHAFGREAGKERYELITPDWAIHYKDYYIETACLLRLIDRQEPILNEYDSCWIAGASRVVLFQRKIDYKYYIHRKNIKIKGETLVLAGKRELWANIDGMSPEIHKKLLEASKTCVDIDTIHFPISTDDHTSKILEGQQYMLDLAQFYNIKLNVSKPFIEYTCKDECPSGRFPNRIYANYDANHTLELTETLLAQDLLRTCSINNTNDINIIDTLVKDQQRPDTGSTVQDAFERFVQNILAGKYGEQKLFNILLCSSNPCIERQMLVAQQEIDQITEKYNLLKQNYEFKIEGVGFSTRQQLTIIHSELGALITEKYKIAMKNIANESGKQCKRNIQQLLFRTRDKNTFVPNMPNNHFKLDDHFVEN